MSYYSHTLLTRTRIQWQALFDISVFNIIVCVLIVHRPLLTSDTVSDKWMALFYVPAKMAAASGRVDIITITRGGNVHRCIVCCTGTDIFYWFNYEPTSAVNLFRIPLELWPYFFLFFSSMM